MKRIYVTVLLLTITSSIVVGQERRAPKLQARRATPEIKSSSNISQARNEANKAWGQYFTRCGDSYFTRVVATGLVLSTRSMGGYIGEYRPVSITVKESPLTQADKLNGIEWKGYTRFDAPADRLYLKEWSAWSSEGIHLHIELWKQSGTWNIGEVGSFYVKVTDMLRKISCSEIPNLANETGSQPPTRFRLKDQGDSLGSTWSRIDSTTWVEDIPDGQSYEFRVVERAKVDGIQGTILRRNPDNLDIFIPDMSSGSVLVKARAQGNTQWSPLREMVDIEDK